MRRFQGAGKKPHVASGKRERIHNVRERDLREEVCAALRQMCNIREVLSRLRRTLFTCFGSLLEKYRFDEVLYVRENVTENYQAHQDAGQGKRAAPNPIDITPGSIFAHEQHDD